MKIHPGTRHFLQQNQNFLLLGEPTLPRGRCSRPASLHHITRLGHPQNPALCRTSLLPPSTDGGGGARCTCAKAGVVPRTKARDRLAAVRLSQRTVTQSVWWRLGFVHGWGGGFGGFFFSFAAWCPVEAPWRGGRLRSWEGERGSALQQQPKRSTWR